MEYASAGDKQMQCKEKVPLTSVLIQPTQEVSWSFNFKVGCKSEENEDKMMDGGQDEDKMMDGGRWKSDLRLPLFFLWSKPELRSFLQMNPGTE